MPFKKSLLSSLIILSFLPFASHASDDDKVKNQQPPSFQASEKLTGMGHNRQALFVDDDSILFISSHRKKHKDSQIYFRELKSGKEKRITYQRGQIINGIWLGKDHKVIYSSTTDEDKETPHQLKGHLLRYPTSIDTNFFFHISLTPSEIYSSEINGDNVQRLSHHMGFDAFPAFIEKNNLLYFSRMSNKNINIFAKDPKKAKFSWKVSKTSGHDLGLQASPDQNQWTWFRFSPDFKSSQIMTSNLKFKNQKFVTLDSGIHWSPTWHPNGKTILFSAKRAPASHYDLFEVRVEDGCERQLTGLVGDEFYPAVSPNGKKVLFTSTSEGSEQIHKMNYPAFHCTK